MGESFSLFPLGRTSIDPREEAEEYPAIPRLTSRIMLGLDGEGPALPVVFTTIIAWASRDQAFAPFTPELGYHVTMEDFDGDERLRKVAATRAFPRQDIPGQPLHLGAYIDREDLAATDILPGDAADTPLAYLLPRHCPALERLTLHVWFPNGLRFASFPHFTHTGVNFHHAFFPCDAGPLAVPQGYKHILEPGLLIALPPDPERLATIEGRFFLR